MSDQLDEKMVREVIKEFRVVMGVLGWSKRQEQMLETVCLAAEHFHGCRRPAWHRAAKKLRAALGATKEKK